MAYDSPKFNLKGQAIVGQKDWVYYDTGGETDADVYAAVGYFTDAKDKGVSVGDRVEVYNGTTAVWQSGRMVTVQDTGGTQGTWTNDTGQ